MCVVHTSKKLTHHYQLLDLLWLLTSRGYKSTACMAVQDGHDASGWCQTFQFILSYPTQPTVSNAHATTYRYWNFRILASMAVQDGEISVSQRIKIDLDYLSQRLKV